jgi:cysteine desulfurase
LPFAVNSQELSIYQKIMQIYLDYSATTPPRSEVIKILQETLSNQWGNPSSLHSWGERAAIVMETARIQVASLINAANPSSIVFTSGGTEADNLAIFGVTRNYCPSQHIIISSVEHSAIEQPAKFLETKGWKVTRLPVNRQGRVNPSDLKSAIQENTVLISIIYGQSEVGTIQPIEELAAIAKMNNILFHTDAVQVAGRLPIDVQALGVDLLSLSSHKIYGIQGAGALYIRPGVELIPLIDGGKQESGLRSGTQALPAIAAFGVASSLAQTEIETETIRLRYLRDHLFESLKNSTCLQPTGDRLHRLPHHVSFIVNNPLSEVTGRSIVRQLNLAGIGISAGSACNSGKISPSPILLAMGYSNQESLKSIRITLGKHTTLADIDWTAVVLKQLIRCEV